MTVVLDSIDIKFDPNYGHEPGCASCGDDLNLEDEVRGVSIRHLQCTPAINQSLSKTMKETAITRCEDSAPNEEDLRAAYELELQSVNGKTVRFGDLVCQKGDHITTIVVFIRHFFCAYDQDYVRTVSHHLTDSILQTMPHPTGPSQLMIIGCGDPGMIGPYVAETSTRFPIYTDPSGRIYEKLQMTRTAKNITQPPSYTKRSFLKSLGITLKQMSYNGMRAFKGGPWNMNGGEWVFRDGKCVYVHRMKHVSDHLTAEKLMEILGRDEGKRAKVF